MKNIVLIGMMGAGKTTVGRLLAHTLGREFIDTDALIEQRQGLSIPDLFARHGENYFRALESEVCRELSHKTGLVIACGGGLPLRPDCFGHLTKNGRVFWLHRDPEEIYDGLDVSSRPLAQDGRAAFLALAAQRACIYHSLAEHTISGAATPQQAVQMIFNTLHNEEGKQ